MHGGNVPYSREPKLRTFHAALWSYALEKDRTMQMITIPQWQALLVKRMGAMSRQSVVDYTWLMDALGLIKWTKGEGVTLVAPTNPELPGTPDGEALHLVPA